jgi:hypothetical protein
MKTLQPEKTRKLKRHPNGSPLVTPSTVTGSSNSLCFVIERGVLSQAIYHFIYDEELNMQSNKPDRRERLELEIAQKQAQLKDLEAKDRVKERKRDTRRKILAGSVVLAHIDKDEVLKSTIADLLDAHIVGKNDRQLFDFLPLEDK